MLKLAAATLALAACSHPGAWIAGGAAAVGLGALSAANSCQPNCQVGDSVAHSSAPALIIGGAAALLVGVVERAAQAQHPRE